ncbi:MAG: hypothetical protein U9R50_11060 [Campylobacterota bacterium]|nr:hypothetical protein [Campylobacterota bacterium]
MSKGWLGLSIDAVNSIWDAGTKVYDVAKSEINGAIDDETRARLKKEGITPSDAIYTWRFNEEREKVEKEAQGLALKGGAIVLGVGILV